MKQLFILCDHEVTNENGAKFMTYYGYRQQEDKDGNTTWKYEIKGRYKKKNKFIKIGEDKNE